MNCPYQMLRPTIGMIPTESVAARIGERMKRMMMEAMMMVIPLINIETLVLRVS
jgi:hypothetical protein